MLMPKRPRLDSPSAFKSHTPSPTPSLKSESSSRSRKSDESDSDTDVAGLAEIMDEINCTVCKWVAVAYVIAGTILYLLLLTYKGYSRYSQSDVLFMSIKVFTVFFPNLFIPPPCRSFDVFPRNRLVECQECHALYHQECHKPPVTDQDVNDPRLVWYCAKCAKSLKKQVVLGFEIFGSGFLSFHFM